MKTVFGITALALGLAIYSGRSAETPAADSKAGPNPAPASTNEVAVLTTSEGQMVIAFWPDVAPKTVENFKTLAKKGFFDGTCFHRIIKGFMIQGGDPLTKDPQKEAAWGTGDPGYKIKGETNHRPDRGHDRGVISMANSGHPDTAGSQFFICLGSPHQLDGGYTTFGKLIKGEDTLEKIGNVECRMVPGGDGQPSRPVKRVELVSVKIVPADSIK